jgi:DNA primase
LIPAGFIQDLLARVDIVDLVGRHVALKRAGQNYLGLCPFHGEKTPSFTVSRNKQFFHCFGCGAHGSAIGFLMDHRGLAYVEAVREIAQQAGLTVPDDVARDAAAARAPGLVEVMQLAASFYQRALRASSAVDYLKRRGITGKTAQRFGLGFAPEGWQALRAAVESYDDPRLVDAGLVLAGEGKRYDRFRNRLMFPIRNRRGAVVGFGGRVLDATEPKYLNSPETALFRKGQEIYGLYEAMEAIRRRGRAIVCEGYMDVIQLAQAGFDDAVATLGTAVSDSHVSGLLRLADHIVFAFDGDAAGIKAARRALEVVLPVIGDSKRASFVFLPEGNDPDDLVRVHGPGSFAAEIDRALPLSRWFERCLSEGRDLDQAEDRAAMVDAARPLLATMPAGALRIQLVQQLAESSRTAPAELDRLFGLQPWRRLPERRDRQDGPDRGLRAQGGLGRHATAVPDLKMQLLQRLIAFPVLPPEFDAAISRGIFAGDHPVDRQIAEVWRTASNVAASHSAGLLEALADSEFADRYRALATRELLAEADLAAARDDVRAGLTQLELDRVNRQIDTLTRIAPLTDDGRAQLRELFRLQADLKRHRNASVEGRQ